MIKVLSGVGLILIGAAVGLYVGLWLMVVGGLIDLIEFAKQDFEPYGKLGWGIVKVLLALPVGRLAFLLFLVPGTVLIEVGASKCKPKPKRR